MQRGLKMLHVDRISFVTLNWNGLAASKSRSEKNGAASEIGGRILNTCWRTNERVELDISSHGQIGERISRWEICTKRIVQIEKHVAGSNKGCKKGRRKRFRIPLKMIYPESRHSLRSDTLWQRGTLRLELWILSDKEFRVFRSARFRTLIDWLSLWVTQLY